MNCIGTYEDEVPISDQANVADIISLLIPEMAIPNSDALPIVLAHCDLDYILIVAVFSKAFKLIFYIFSDAFG